jgi:hypothetical protein
MVIGAKRIETRSWYTAYRGLVGIHASKGYPPDARNFAKSRPVYELLLDGGFSTISSPGVQEPLDMTSRGFGEVQPMPFGSIVAVGRLDECKSTEALLYADAVTKQERLLGNYQPGRYGFLIGDIVRLPEPIPARGMLGLWTPDATTAEQLVSFWTGRAQSRL